MAWGRESTISRGGDIGCLDSGHGRNIDDPRRPVGIGPLEQEVVKAHSHVENGLDVQRHQLVPSALRKIIIRGAPSCASTSSQELAGLITNSKTHGV